ncbi:MAG: SDR family NAD(P)-dependent oxidoreductase [Acidobacteriota bacterium]|jgi:NAD(P)-dependent dehydrogenase (short-subunit alcohol dehydrogenase family)|nr:SDR family NAD(P)-dependent oxidoreductase [Acidobacteriota bacterium]NLT32011.1 SDR family oxidoreductase [Acidobacteriota bacterium]
MKISDLFDVKGYGAVITGGASGIGLGYAEALAAAGARVTLLDVDGDRLEAETARLGREGFDVQGRLVDVTNHGALDAAVAEATERYGRLDAVFANAGIDPGPGFVGAWAGSERPRLVEGALENYTDERWNRVVEINLNGIFATVRAAARHMKPRKSGRIVITTSLASTRVEPAIGAAYMAAKAGAAQFMRTVALELAAFNITVNAVAPGYIVTNIGGGHSQDPVEQEAVARMIPMHRVGFPSDLYGLALFLVSRASDYITGQEIVVDGGWGLGAAD